MSSLLVIFSLQALKCKFTWENMISCAVFDMREFDLSKKPSHMNACKCENSADCGNLE